MIYILVILTGITGNSFLEIENGARESGMGGIGFLYSNGPEAIHWNPSGIAGINIPNLSFTHTEYFQDIRYEDIVFIYPKKNFTMGYGLKGLYMNGFEARTGPSPEPDYIFGSSFSTGTISFARFLGENMAIGTGINIIYEKIDKYGGVGIAADFGMHYNFPFIEGISYALSVKNIGTPVKLHTSSTLLPININMGIGYHNDYITGGMGFSISDRIHLLIGIEGNFQDKLFIRTGYRTGFSAAGNLAGVSAGFGLKITNINIDYSVRPFGDLGIVQYIGINYGFKPGKGRVEKQRIIAKELEKKGKITSGSFYTMAISRIREKDYKDAEKLLDIALIWDPNNTEAKQKLEGIEMLRKKQIVSTYISKGKKYYKKGKYMDAMDVFSKALEAQPDNIVAQKWFDAASNALSSKGDTKFDKMVKAGLDNFGKGKYARAIKDWKSALRIKPKNKAVLSYIKKAKRKMKIEIEKYTAKVEGCIKSKDFLKAKWLMDKIIKMSSKNTNVVKKMLIRVNAGLKEAVNVHINKGIALYNKGKYAEAEIHFSTALKFLPSSRTAKQWLRKTKKKRRTGEIDINDLYMKGINAYTSDKIEEAIAYWEKVIEIDPTYKNAKKNLQRANEKLKKIKEIQENNI